MTISITGKGIELDKKEAISGIGKPPPSGLVPLGDTGLYASPDEPVDPRDCDRYPDSPWCGGNPVSRTPVGIDLEPTLQFDKCGVKASVTAKATLGFIKLPEFSLAYIDPNCRPDYETKPPPEQRKHKNGFIAPPTNWPDGIGDSEEVIAIISRNIAVFDHWSGNMGFYSSKKINVDYPYKRFINGELDYNKVVAIPRRSNSILRLLYEEVEELPGRTNKELKEMHFLQGDFPEYSNFTGVELAYGGGYSGYNQIIFAKGAFGAVKDLRRVGDFSRVFQPISLVDGLFTYYWDVLWVKVLNPKPNKEKLPPTSGDYGKRDCECMSCCTGGYQDSKRQEQDNRKLLALLRKIDKKLGDFPQNPHEYNEKDKVPKQNNITSVAQGLRQAQEFIHWTLTKIGLKNYPVKHPRRLVYPNGKGDVELHTLLEQQGYQIRQIDRAVGNLPQKIKIKDTNPALKGDQSVELQIHSFADFAKHMLQYLVDTEGDVDATNNMLVRCLYELGFIHQGSVQNNYMLDAICEALDFKQNYKKVKVPFAFDPYAGTNRKTTQKAGQGFGQTNTSKNLDKNTEESTEELLPYLLQNTEVTIKVLINEDQKSINDVLMDIKKDTAVASAGVAERASEQRLEQLIEACLQTLKLDGIINRQNIRAAITSGSLKTSKKK